MVNVWEEHTQQNPETYEPISFPVLEGGISEVIYCPFCRDLFIQVDVAGMTSGESVTGRIEGSLDGVTWDNMDADDEDTVIAVNGMTLFKYPGAIPPYVRASGFATTVEGSLATLELQFHIASMV